MVARLYNAWINSERQAKSEHTIASYQQAMRLFLMEYLDNTLHLANDTFDINKAFSMKTISEWLSWMQNNRACKPQTINHRRGSILRFLYFLGKNEPTYLTFYLEAKVIQKHKVVPTKVHGFTTEALKALLSAPNLRTKTGRRDCVLMSLLYATGARINELLTTKIRDVRLAKRSGDTSTITFYGKGNKYRCIPLLEPTVQQLQVYIKEFHNNEQSPDHYLFYSKSKGKMCPLTQKAVSYRLKTYARLAHEHCEDVPLNAHTHQFRHTRATNWIRENHPLPAVSSLLGHASPETTMTYLDITPDMIADATKSVASTAANVMKQKWDKEAVDIRNLFDF